jgi:hypothetical protein
MNTYTPPPIHPLNDEEMEYINSLDPKEKALHTLAVEKLGSSYFVWKSHGYQAWKQKCKKD